MWIQEDEESDGSSEPTAGWDMRVQEYEGEKVLTWWEGIVDTPLAEGEVVVVDDSYEEIARVGMGNDLPHRMVDLHETTITDEGTMLLMAYVPKQADLTVDRWGVRRLGLGRGRPGGRYRDGRGPARLELARPHPGHGLRARVRG